MKREILCICLLSLLVLIGCSSNKFDEDNYCKSIGYDSGEWVNLLGDVSFYCTKTIEEKSETFSDKQYYQFKKEWHGCKCCC